MSCFNAIALKATVQVQVIHHTTIFIYSRSAGRQAPDHKLTTTCKGAKPVSVAGVIHTFPVVLFHK